MANDPAWNEPSTPIAPRLAPGLRMAPAAEEPKLELELVEDPKTIEELQYKIARLEHDNKVLMNQIEEAWAVIKSRDEQIVFLQTNTKPWER